MAFTTGALVAGWHEFSTGAGLGSVRTALVHDCPELRNRSAAAISRNYQDSHNHLT
ncbi:MAG: hypothetical protein JNK99_00280 [Candidatus Accumulibacter sp.]|jgi:hypothetical protein|uniref:hypothetical protein n=1 Tax=Accumulibacter sp. TaxID=2053492 RepID=UPI001A3D99E8|nr:hypothetical protein [Accumulibacter sp.]MBL8393173.1 hypothetical protein [Accumulibacter sp.]